MNEGTRSGKSTIRLLGISAERPTNGLYLLPLPRLATKHTRCKFFSFTIQQFLYLNVAKINCVMKNTETKEQIKTMQQNIAM
jgi:hypothetical protein